MYSLRYCQETTTSVLPDNVLLEIFYFYKEDNVNNDRPVWKWDLLVHVCRRWRQVVFGSPLRLDLRILCTERTPVGKNLCIWPALPIYVDFDWSSDLWNGDNASRESNIVTALKHVDRVCDIRLRVTGSELEKITTVMQEPFPALTSLYFVVGQRWAGPSRRILGRIRTTFTAHLYVRHPLSVIPNASFVHQ